MPNVTKRHIVTSINGTDELFQLPEDYLPGTLWTDVVTSSGNVTRRENSYFAGGYFQISPPPPVGSKIYCTYEIEDSSTDPSLFEIEEVHINHIEDILKIVKNLNESVKSLDKAVDNRVSLKAFNQYAEKMSNTIRYLKLDKMGDAS